MTTDAGYLCKLLHRKQLRAGANVCRSRGRSRVVDSARMLSKSPSYRDRLPRANLGTRRISLPYPATTSHLISAVALCESLTNDAGDHRPLLQVSINRLPRFVNATEHFFL